MTATFEAISIYKLSGYFYKNFSLLITCMTELKGRAFTFT